MASASQTPLLSDAPAYGGNLPEEELPPPFAPAEPSAPPGALEQTVRLLRARKWLILVGALLGGALALALTLSGDDQYKAKATLLFAEPATADFLGEVPRQTDPDRAAATRSELLSLDVVARATAQEIGAGVTADEVADSVEVKSQDEADVVNVEASADSPGRAAQFADTYARAFVDLRRSADRDAINEGIRRLRDEIARLTPIDRDGPPGRALERRLNDLIAARPLQTGNAEVVQAATAPAGAEERHTVRNTAIGVGLGALLALLLGSVLERLDRRVTTVEDFEDIYGLPVIARIPRSRVLNERSKGRPSTDMLSKASGFSEEAEAFRALRANLPYLGGGDLKSLLIVSPTPGDGKSTIARFLAITMASMGDRVVLVDADLRKFAANAPAVSGPGEGLSLVLAGFDLDEALTEILVAFDPVSEEPRGLVELSSGPLPPNPSELLESERMAWVIEELEARFDRVIIDSPAIASVSDALALVPQVSGALVVSGVNKTTRNAAIGLHKQLLLLPGHALGVVANFWNPEGERYYYYGNDRR